VLVSILGALVASTTGAVLGSISAFKSTSRMLELSGGGKKGRSAKGGGRSPAKRSRRPDYDDEDNESEYEIPRSRAARSKSMKVVKSSSKKGGRGKQKQRRGRRQSLLASWVNSPAAQNLKESLIEKVDDLKETGTKTYKDVYRRAKVMRSSAFEAMLLKATWPGDEPVPLELLDEIVKHSIPAFKYGKVAADDDPYVGCCQYICCSFDVCYIVYDCWSSLSHHHLASHSCTTNSCLTYALHNPYKIYLSIHLSILTSIYLQSGTT